MFMEKPWLCVAELRALAGLTHGQVRSVLKRAVGYGYVERQWGLLPMGGEGSYYKLGERGERWLEMARAIGLQGVSQLVVGPGRRGSLVATHTPPH